MSKSPLRKGHGRKITKITASSGDDASYTYDPLNQLKTESITESGITRTISYEYDSHGNMTKRVEGNKETVYTYDLDRLIQIEEKENGVTTSTQTLAYDNAGNLTTDGEFTYTWQMGRQLQGITGADLTTSYKYNENGLRTQKTVNGQTHEYTLLGSSVTREVIRDNAGTILWTIHYSYAGEGTPVSMNVNGTEYYYLKNAQGDITHIVDGDGNEVALKSITINSGASFEYYFDEKGLPNRAITTLNSGYKLYTQYIYNQRGLLENYQHDKETYTYEFDVKGNITKITAGSGDEASYTYDSLNQLTSESITEDGITRTISYEYDSHGNMTKRVEGNKETVYTYDLDRLIQIEEKENGVTTSTQTLAYDNAGNLTTDGEFTYTWQMGRQLQGITGADLTTSYKYNENGLRTQKTVNGQTHEYTLLGSSVTREVIRDNAGTILWTIHYSYAGEGTPVSMNVNGTEYYYLKNAQGDITHIVDGDGNEVASYEYDAWGNHLSITGGDIAQLNPYRYRGYRYDSETGLYYLQSRYYNPEWGRFVNADTFVSTGQGLLAHNMYVYCNNNPANEMDPYGYFAVAVTLVATNWWNPVGWTIAAVGVVYIGYQAGKAIKKQYNRKRDRAKLEKSKATRPTNPSLPNKPSVTPPPKIEFPPLNKALDNLDPGVPAALMAGLVEGCRRIVKGCGRLMEWMEDKIMEKYGPVPPAPAPDGNPNSMISIV